MRIKYSPFLLCPFPPSSHLPSPSRPPSSPPSRWTSPSSSLQPSPQPSRAQQGQAEKN